MLVLMTGLPGTGKSTIATALARALPAAILSADPIDAALVRAGVARAQRPDIIGYEVMKALAAEHLAAGLSVVIDAVNPFVFVRQAYFDIAARCRTPVAVIVTTCSDEAIHRTRMGKRQKVDWPEVLRQRDYYEPFEGEGLVLDSLEPPSTLAASAIAYVESRRSPPAILDIVDGIG